MNVDLVFLRLDRAFLSCFAGNGNVWQSDDPFLEAWEEKSTTTVFLCRDSFYVCSVLYTALHGHKEEGVKGDPLKNEKETFQKCNFNVFIPHDPNLFRTLDILPL